MNPFGKASLCVIALALEASCVDEGSAPVTRDEILVPRETAARVDEKDYLANDVTVRLFGVERGDGVLPPSAIVADVRTWRTHVLREHDLFGRGHRVARIDDDGVTIPSARGPTIRLERGVDVRLRIVRHRLDVVAKPLGRHRYEIDPAAARAAHERDPSVPSADAIDWLGTKMLRLGVVKPGSLFAEAGFREGDLVAGASLDDIQRALVSGTPMRVSVLRGGARLELEFSTP